MDSALGILELLTNYMYHQWMRFLLGSLAVTSLFMRKNKGKDGHFLFSPTLSSAVLFLVLAVYVPALYRGLLNEEWTDVGLSASILLICTTKLTSVLFDFHGTKETPEKDDHPESTASLWSSISLSWLSTVVWQGYRKGLCETDLPPVPRSDKCSTLCPVFEAQFKRAEPTAPLQPGHSNRSLKNVLVKCIIRTYGLRFFMILSVMVLFGVLDYIQPVFVGQLISFIENREHESVWKGYGLAVAIFFLSTILECGSNRLNKAMLRLTHQIQTALKMAIFKKSLTAKNEKRVYLTSGEVGTLVSDDCKRVTNCIITFSAFISVPFEIITALFFLYQELGIGAFAGVVVLGIMSPFHIFLGKWLKTLNVEKQKNKDARIKLMNEILNGIKVLKLYAWENSFLDKVKRARTAEDRTNMKIALFHGGLDFVFFTIPYLVRVSALAVFIFMNGSMSPSKAYIIVSLFWNLNNSFTTLPMNFPGFFRAYESTKSINTYLTLEDIPRGVVSKDPHATSAVSIQNGVFSWDTVGDNAQLNEIDLDIPRGKLVAVVGRVGCGKSSLLAAILGEMEKLSGFVTVQSDNIAYVPQEAWIQSCSIRDNITFISEFHETFYNEVIDSCALGTDLKQLRNGDRTVLGEKGINLSGGQKQRVSLARAVYSQAEIYLLDDPLSAVDAHVGKYIFKHVISNEGMLRNKTRILVTNGVNWLPFVDSIAVMSNGQISEQGTFNELLALGGEFSDFLQQIFSEETLDRPGHISLQQMKEKILSGAKISELEPFPSKESKQQQRDRNGGTESESDVNSREKSNDEISNETVKNKESDEGLIGKAVYLDYIKTIGVWFIVLCVIVYIAEKTVREFNRFWLGRWGDDPFLANKSITDTREYSGAMWTYLKWYAIFGMLEISLSLTFITTILFRGNEAAKHYHNRLLGNILRAPMVFFETTPISKVIDLFSTSVAEVEGLAYSLRYFVSAVVEIIVNFLMIVYASPGIIPFLIPLAIVKIFLDRVSSANFRSLRRFTTHNASPALVLLSETLRGAGSVRAYKAQDQFSSRKWKKT